MKSRLLASTIAFAALVGFAKDDSRSSLGNPLAGISREVPKSWPCGEFSHGNVKAVWLEGEPLKGRPTRVFAYVALPKGASAAKKVPGIVLAHGGAGSAYSSWAAQWAAHGYAAIIPDNCGCIPLKAPGGNWIPSGMGGPLGWGRTDLADEPVGDQWPYHAVGAIVRAHSYLRSLPEVDAERTGITGISWGGFITLLAAATDTRFRFAAPVYACGFYEEFAQYTDFYRKNGDYRYGFGKDGKAGPRLAAWAALFDPKRYVPDIGIPLFWFASAGDRAFPFDTLQKTVALAPSARLAVRVGMLHGHGKVGDSMPELYLFADSVLKGALALPTVARPVAKDGTFTVAFDSAGRRIRRVDLIWCTDGKPVYATKWETKAFDAPTGDLFSAPLPEGAKRVYANFVFDDEFKDAYYPDAVVSSAAVNL